MLNRSQACAALIAFTSVAFAQEASTPVADTKAQNDGAATSGTQASNVVSADSGQKPDTDESDGFKLPGGMGYTPLNFTPGQGIYDRKPVSFSTTAQQGYDDNTDSSHTNKKGSSVTNLSEGVEVLLAQSRFALSLDASLGGQYYWNRSGDQLTPTAGLSLVFGYKLTPRAQLSGVVNGTYTNQPTNTVVNGAVQSNGRGYFLLNSKFDLLYRWAPRVSTDTAYSISGIYYKDPGQNGGDSTTQTVGQSVRYDFSHLLTGVFEGRASQVQYNSTTSNANIYYLLVGGDLMLSRRLTASSRIGATLRDQDSSNSSTPYAEGSLNYALSRISQIGVNFRYGYNDNGSTGQQSTTSTRAGVVYSQVLATHLRGTLGLNMNYNESSDTTPRDTTISGAAGVQYDVSKDLTVFANYNNIRDISSSSSQEYTKNVYYVGATYSY